MLYHQLIDINAYILFLDSQPVEPKLSLLVLTGTEEKLTGIGLHVHFRLRDLLAQLQAVLQNAPTLSEEMVEWFLGNLPINRTIALSFTLSKNIFKELEDSYYDCQTVDQFLKTRLDRDDIIAPLLNLDMYELVGMELVTDAMSPEEGEVPGFSGSANAQQPDSLFAFLGVVSKMVAVQVGSVLKATLYDLFSVKR